LFGALRSLATNPFSPYQLQPLPPLVVSPWRADFAPSGPRAKLLDNNKMRPSVERTPLWFVTSLPTQWTEGSPIGPMESCGPRGARTNWKALNRRHLKFNDWERAAILHKLQMRNTTSASAASTRPERAMAQGTPARRDCICTGKTGTLSGNIGDYSGSPNAKVRPGTWEVQPRVMRIGISSAKRVRP
jgi:hypothetical protein